MSHLLIYRWDGSPYQSKVDEDKCRATVFPPGGYHSHQCSFRAKVAVDIGGETVGLCGVHDPEAQARRAEKRGPTRFEKRMEEAETLSTAKERVRELETLLREIADDAKLCRDALAGEDGADVATILATIVGRCRIALETDTRGKR